MAFVYIGVGLLLLFGGGEALVRGAVGVSKNLGLSPLWIGLAVISAGTSAPELFVAVNAVGDNVPDIAIGNLVGSNISNILLILAIGAIIRPIPSAPVVLYRDGLALIAASVAFLAAAAGGVVTGETGWMLLSGLTAFLVISFLLDWRRPSPLSVFQTRAQQRGADGHLATGFALFLLAFGLLLLYFGSSYVVTGATAVARQFGVSEATIALSLVAVGTSLPELAATVIAALRRQAGLAIGNILGSNIFNILGVLGATAVIQDVRVADEILREDALVMIGAAVLLMPLLLTGWRLSRGEGLMLLLLYAGYVAFLAARQGLLPV